MGNQIGEVVGVSEAVTQVTSTTHSVGDKKENKKKKYYGSLEISVVRVLINE